MENSVVERINKILIKKNDTINSRSSSQSEQRRLNRQIREGEKITYETIMSICSRYPDLSMDWLLRGDGDKYMQNKGGIPLYSEKAAAGFGSENFKFEERDIEARYKIRELSSASFMLHVVGDSMIPTYKSGDIIAVRTLSGKDDIQWGKPHLISTPDGLLVKRIYEKEGRLIAVSDNPSFPPRFYDWADITGIAVVIGNVRIEGV